MPTRGISEAVRKAVQAPERPAEDTRRDGWRRPAEILALANVKPGSRVLELSPFDMYYSRMLSSVVGAKGTVHMYEFPQVAEQSGEIGKAFAAAHPNTKYEVKDFDEIEFPRNVDVVFSSLAYHLMLLTDVDMEAFHTKLFKAMKPGAIYLVIDHAATHGTGTDDTGRLRRIDPGVVRGFIQSQGFELVEDSRLLENHSDDHKWPVYDKLDQTDQMIYKWRKPVVY
jgi:predicted methyltransferase